MGRCPNNKAGGRQKKYSHKQARRSKFLKKDILSELITDCDSDPACALHGLNLNPKPELLKTLTLNSVPGSSGDLCCSFDSADLLETHICTVSRRALALDTTHWLCQVPLSYA